MVVVLAAAQETGGANVLAPVIRELQLHKGVRVVVIACGKAGRVFCQAGIPCREIKFSGKALDRGFANELESTLAEVSPDVLLLGTAWGPSLEKELLKLARERRVPAISVVDMWSYYRERFTDPVSGELFLPTRVVVMDSRGFSEAVAAGLPRNVLVVTGQPYLETLMAHLGASGSIRQAEILRARWLSGRTRGKASRVVLFASEALARDFGPQSAYYRGYTEIDALEGVVQAISSCESSSRIQIALVVKLHPEESRWAWGKDSFKAHRPIRVSGKVPALPCILAADVVVGMTSMMLVEAFLAGKPAVSFQPGLQLSDSSDGLFMGRIPVASSDRKLKRLLSSVLSDGKTEPNGRKRLGAGRPGIFRERNAASRIAKMTIELAGARLREADLCLR